MPTAIGGVVPGVTGERGAFPAVQYQTISASNSTFATAKTAFDTALAAVNSRYIMEHFQAYHDGTNHNLFAVMMAVAD